MNIRLFAILFCYCIITNSIFAFNDKDTIIDPYNPDYSEIFKYEYPKALRLYKENIWLFDSICNKYDVDTALAVSIVFPELIRYSTYKDVLETLSLETVYVRLGCDFADFSIGIMQMKPSFAEKTEKYLKTDGNLFKKYRNINVYKTQAEKGIRKERLERLKTVEWQILYLCAFCDIVNRLHGGITFKSKEEKIRFYATAYNSDFNSPVDMIYKQMKNRYFPNGKNGMAPQYSYCEVAVDFYKNYYRCP